MPEGRFFFASKFLGLQAYAVSLTAQILVFIFLLMSGGRSPRLI